MFYFFFKLWLLKHQNILILNSFYRYYAISKIFLLIEKTTGNGWMYWINKRTALQEFYENSYIYPKKKCVPEGMFKSRVPFMTSCLLSENLKCVFEEIVQVCIATDSNFCMK